MTTQNDFLPFATGPGANVVDQTTYAALSALATGFLSGTALSNQLNKVWRQSSIMSAVMAQFIVAQTGQAAVDDGTTPTLLSNFTKAVNAASKQRIILTDTGSVNALAAANAVPMTALPTVSGVVQTISVKVTNTGASTYSPDGLASRPIFGLGGAALQGGEMVANGIATLVSYVGPLLNSGALCWVLFECIGGAQQVAPPTQSQHAAQFAQITAHGAQAYPTPGTYNFTVPANVYFVYGKVRAGGGAGGKADNTNGLGGGGGGGGYCEGLIAVTPGQVLPITVGAGGTATSGNGNSGGSSSIGTYLTASGGKGGGYGNGTTGNGGSGSDFSGSAVVFGAGGAPGNIGYTAGSTFVGGIGGISFGGGFFTNTALTSTSGSPGSPGSGWGCGGNGGIQGGTGGDGIAGYVYLTW